MSLSQKVDIAQVKGGNEVFDSNFLEYLIALNNKFTPIIHSLRLERNKVLKDCLDNQTLPLNNEKSIKSFLFKLVFSGSICRSKRTILQHLMSKTTISCPQINVS